ncbi:Uncharacterized protein Fot_29410 [Forsythia ovata]|uniref:Uncharacterized protein n=1 Tax=Forsythia ovata TaxID=205694 RepID=A0ABD1TRS2_9LAMI
MLKPHVPSYIDLIPLLQSHEMRNKSQLFETINPNLAFVGQHSSSLYQKKCGHNSSLSSRGRDFSQSSSRPTYNRQQILHPDDQTEQQHIIMRSLHEKVSFLLSFLDVSSLQNSDKLRGLKGRIRDAIYEVEDIIEFHMSNQIFSELD